MKNLTHNYVVDETIDLYKLVGWKKYFSKIRFWDAPFIKVEKLIPKKGLVLDLGCGEGIFSNFLALKSKNRKIIGIELNKERISQASKGLINTKFFRGDVTSKEIPKADTILMFHLLHHLNNFKDQEKLLEKSVKKLKKNGKLIIVEVEPKWSVKYLMAYLTDHFLVPLLFERKFYSKVFFRKSIEWKKILIDLGLSVKLLPAEKGMPFSHIIILCQKN